jgi:hypothetical protein
MDFRSEYLLKNSVRMTPLKATSSKIDGNETSRLGDPGGRSPEKSNTLSLINSHVIVSPLDKRKTSEPATWQKASIKKQETASRGFRSSRED